MQRKEKNSRNPGLLWKWVGDDLSVLSMSVMGFQKKVWMGVGGWVGGWDELYPS